MVQAKKMNETFFAQLLKDFNSVGELIRARQDEKQALIDQYEAESKRFFFGKISEKALVASSKKANKELKRLDSEIRKAIARAKTLSDRARKLTSNQAPLGFKATLSGIVALEKKKTKKTKKRVVKKKTKKKAKKKSKSKVKKKIKKKAVKKK